METDNLDFSSSSGAIHVDSIAAQTLECDTTSGSVHIGAIEADAIELESTSGTKDGLVGNLLCGKTVGIVGAACDVFKVEPPLPAGRLLLHCPNTIVTPHIAFASVESMEQPRSGSLHGEYDADVLYPVFFKIPSRTIPIRPPDCLP